MKKVWLVRSLVVCIILMPHQIALAASCSVSVLPLVFGEYQPLSGNALDSSADITVTCTRTAKGAEKFNYTIALSLGGGSFTQREMSTPSGGILYYNLYSDPARMIVWGDGAGAGLVGGQFHLKPSDPQPTSKVHTVYGRVFANQILVAPGYYVLPPIMVTLDYQ